MASNFRVLGKMPSDLTGITTRWTCIIMGSGTMCVLSGTIKATWGAADSQTIGQLDPECTKGYTEGFQVIASVKMEGKQVWVQSGAAASFQLFLRGKGHSELAIWTSLEGIEGKAVTVNLDGITLASGSGPKQCLPSQVLGDRRRRSRGNKSRDRKSAQDAPRIKELKNKLSKASQAGWLAGWLAAKDTKPSVSPTEQTTGSDFDGCRLVQNQVNTSQPGFALKSVLKPANMVIMGKSFATRTCVLRGVVKFTSVDSTAIAFLDPNYRDPTTRMPFCFPMATMIFLASVTDSNNSRRIARTLALRIEPHGRMVVIGKEPRDVSVRLDNIMYHPLMEFNFSPRSCAPYCFPHGREGNSGMVNTHT